MHTDVDPGSPVDRPTHQGSAPAHLAAAVTAAKCGQGRGVDYRYWRITPRPRTVGGVRWPTFAAVGPARTSGSLPAAARGTARRCPTASPAPWSSPLCIPLFSSAASAPRPSVAPSGLTTGCSILGCTPSSTEIHAAKPRAGAVIRPLVLLLKSCPVTACAPACRPLGLLFT